MWPWPVVAESNQVIKECKSLIPLYSEVFCSDLKDGQRRAIMLKMRHGLLWVSIPPAAFVNVVPFTYKYNP
jgi:hypothetical protein